MSEKGEGGRKAEAFDNSGKSEVEWSNASLAFGSNRQREGCKNPGAAKTDAAP